MRAPMLSTRAAAPLAVAVAVAIAAVPRPACAFERQWHAGAAAGIATLSGSEPAPALGVHAAYGLSDMFDIDLELTGSRHGSAPRVDVLGASAGIAYKIDVFEWVPYATLLGGYYRFAGGGGPHGGEAGEIGTSLGIGLDYLASRHVAIGFQLRGHDLLLDGIDWPGSDYLTALLQGEYRWGW